jgi:hypothetical protein
MRPITPSPTEDTKTTLAIGIALWAAAVAAGCAYGVFARLSPEEFAGLAVFASLAAAGAYWLDPNVRAFARSRARGAMKAIAPATLALALVDLAASPWDARLAAWPHALVVLFLLPLGAAMVAAVLDARERPAPLTSPASKSPGARPAAT